MGTSYYTTVVFGVRENKTMRKARNVTVQQTRPVCSNKPEKHKIDPWKAPNFCSRCGAKVEEQLVPRSYMIPPEVAYAAPGLDPEDEDSCMDNMQEWVHTDGPASDGGIVVLGICLLHKDAREDLGAFDIPEPTEEQVAAVVAYLNHLGMNALPTLHLILGAW